MTRSLLCRDAYRDTAKACAVHLLSEGAAAVQILVEVASIQAYADFRQRNPKGKESLPFLAVRVFPSGVSFEDCIGRRDRKSVV